METVESWIDKQEFKTTNDVKVPKVIVEQVIGQEKAVEVIKKAAEQKRHVMLIGEPGTGKSMLARSMAELLPKGKLEDVIAYPNPEDSNMPKVRVVPAGKGKNIVNTQKIEAVKRKSQKTSMMMLIIFMIVGFAVIYFVETGNIMVVFYGIIAAAILFWVFWMTMFRGGPMMKKDMVPKLLISHKPDDIPPFIDATGAHAGALLGDIRHDPFQSGGLETPAHERVEIGALQKANKGVLFIDEINTLRLESQQNLLTAMQEKKFSISGQSERSAGAMVKTEPVPCDFILVVAGNLDAVKGMHPALRSRIRGYGYEIYMKSTMPDNDENRKKLVRFVAQEIKNDAKIPHFDKNAVGEIIREAQRRSGRKGELSLRLRELGGLVRIAGDIAVENFVKSMPNKEDAMKIVKEKAFVTAENILSAKKIARSLEQQVADRFIEKGKEYKSFKTTGYEVGAVNGLAVLASDPSMAEYSGVVLPIVAEVTPAGSRSEGKIIATGKLGEIAKEAVQNVSALIKKYTGKDISNYDVHIQFIGTHEGVEGDSASISVAAAIISAMENVEIDQTVGMTGSLSIRGGVLPVGGITAKIEAAAESGLRKVLIPKANLSDVLIEEKYRNKIEVIPVETLKDVLSNALAGSVKKEGLLEKLAKLVPKRTELPLPSGA
ncbi:MAG: ATP-dependent protease LonB [Candidatus Thermoplasmatota archaeon]|nr:ATP-dependent protease LonB [Candidatus Thermoplasmatota archaeon]